mmetsp:Transcript_19226/g.39710  ORF Transcript_19226/g.39710 Transcript_19226/m.39710 type:complete len:408 (+) Transcript_19226:4561-5784(+)
MLLELGELEEGDVGGVDGVLLPVARVEAGVGGHSYLLEELAVARPSVPRHDEPDGVPVAPRYVLPVHLERHDGVAVRVESLLHGDGAAVVVADLVVVVALEADVVGTGREGGLVEAYAVGVEARRLEEVAEPDPPPRRAADGPRYPVGGAEGGHPGLLEVKVLAAVAVALDDGGDVDVVELARVLEVRELVHLLLAADARDGEGVLFRVDIWYESVVAHVVEADGGDEVVRELAEGALGVVGVPGVGEEGRVGGGVVGVRVVELGGARPLLLSLLVAQPSNLVPLQDLQDVPPVMLGIDLPERLQVAPRDHLQPPVPSRVSGELGDVVDAPHEGDDDPLFVLHHALDVLHGHEARLLGAQARHTVHVRAGLGRRGGSEAREEAGDARGGTQEGGGGGGVGFGCRLVL